MVTCTGIERYSTKILTADLHYSCHYEIGILQARDLVCSCEVVCFQCPRFGTVGGRKGIQPVKTLLYQRLPNISSWEISCGTSLSGFLLVGVGRQLV